MHIFYTPEILTSLELPSEEAQHCTRVLRLKERAEIMLTNGKGLFFKAQITYISSKRCDVEILETISCDLPWRNRIHIAMAPAKNMDRNEWFVEKAVEIGINQISFLDCRYSERVHIKTDRIEKIMIAAMKQSQKAVLPQLEGIIDFDKFITRDFGGQKFIAHCHPEDKRSLSGLCQKGEDILVLIGPEGDFSKEEVDKAVQYGFLPVSLGKSRLRTETAALAACHTIHIINEL